MTKQQQPQPSSYNEPISAELLLRPHTITEEILAEVKKRNDDVISEIEVIDTWAKSSHDKLARRNIKASEIFVQYEDPRSKKNKLRWLSQVRNQRSGKFYTLKNLIDNGVIDESEKDLFEFPPVVEDFPYREIYQFKRVKTRTGEEFLDTHEQWVGLSKIAAVHTISVSDLNWYIRPKVSHELRNVDGSIIKEGYSVMDNKTIQISTTTMGATDEPTGIKTYITRFTPEIAHSALKLAHGSYTDLYNGCSLTLVKEGDANPKVVKDPELWINGNFDELFDDLSKPAPTITVDSKSLATFVKMDRESKNKDQYQ